MLYSINEIFYSIQGEGFHTGYPAIFIRLAGCNLKCPWCDTNFDMKRKMGVDCIIRELQLYLIDIRSLEKVIIVITGGEPTLQNYDLLVRSIRKEFPYNVITIETNGRDCSSDIIDRLRRKKKLWVTVSPKKLIDMNFDSYISDPRWRGDELKLVLDPEICTHTIKNLPTRLGNRFKYYYIQPCSENYESAIKFVKENPLWKLSIQTQKLIKIQ